MNYRDRWETGEDGEKFVFTVEMQRRLVEAGYPAEVEYLSQLGSEEVRRAPVQESRPAPASSPPPRREEREEIVEPDSIQIDPQTGKYIGRLKWYNGKKGYGFIMRGAGEEIFFHRSGSTQDPGSLAEGQWVLYDVEETHKGPEANEIEPYEGEG